VTSLIGNKETEIHSPGIVSTPQFDRQSDDGRAEIPGTPDRADRVKFSNNTTTYTNSGHWTSILDGVSLPNFCTLNHHIPPVFAPLSIGIALGTRKRFCFAVLQMHDGKAI
jgi:hypothetical protein